MGIDTPAAPGSIERVLRSDSYFSVAMSADARPAKGIHVEVSIRQVKRGTYLWVLFPPISWISLLRADEEEAIEYSAHRYPSENRDYLHSLKKP